MVYARRYGGTRYRARRGVGGARRIARTRPTASNQKRQLLAMSRDISRVKRDLKDQTQMVQYAKSAVSGVTGDVATFGLFDASMNSVFGQSTNAQEASKITFKKMNLQLRVFPANEAALCDFTIFVITPKTFKVYQETSGMSGWTHGTDYYQQGGLTFMNLKRFHVHKVWKNISTAGALNTVGGTIHLASTHDARRYMKHRCNITLQTHSDASWKDISESELPLNSRYRLLAFNNNSGLDAENPKVEFNCLWTGYTTA